MRDFVTTFAKTVKPLPLIALSLLLLPGIGPAPARAQDIFSFLGLFSRPAAAVPTYQPFEQPVARPHPKAVRVEQPAIKMPLKPKAPGEITNPVPELLADNSLRPGDMVMFPDGLRVFTGQVGDRHQLADFEPVSQAGKAVPRVVRNLVANLRPGKNSAWNAQGLDTSGKLASNARSD
jgi:hypothetical protein